LPPTPATSSPGRYGSSLACRAARCWVPASGWIPPACGALAQTLDIGAQSIDAFILGEHGDTQFPVWSHSSVYGSPIADVYQQRTGQNSIATDWRRARKLGFEIYARKGCTEYGVAGTIAEICRNIFTGSHRALAISCILDGEYGVSGAAAGVPAVLAQGGVQQIIELQLAEDEQAKFNHSVSVIKPISPVCPDGSRGAVGNDQLQGKGKRLAGIVPAGGCR
jgi:malate/lactate dehydrogenase